MKITVNEGVCGDDMKWGAGAALKRLIITERRGGVMYILKCP